MTKDRLAALVAVCLTFFLFFKKKNERNVKMQHIISFSLAMELRAGRFLLYEVTWLYFFNWNFCANFHLTIKHNLTPPVALSAKRLRKFDIRLQNYIGTHILSIGIYPRREYIYMVMVNGFHKNNGGPFNFFMNSACL